MFISNHRNIFSDRLDAARQLAQRLRQFEDSHPLILAIPRGGVPIGKVIATMLHGDLDVVLVRKLAAAFDPEYALGSIDEAGQVWRSDDLTAAEEESFPRLADIKSEQLKELKRRRDLYTPIRRPIQTQGRIVIVVDDGLATGASMAAALHSARHQHPAKLVCAIPVAAIENLRKITPLADEIICLHALSDFGAVSQYYRHFPQIEDAEVVSQLSDGSC